MKRKKILGVMLLLVIAFCFLVSSGVSVFASSDDSITESIEVDSECIYGYHEMYPQGIGLCHDITTNNLLYSGSMYLCSKCGTYLFTEGVGGSPYYSIGHYVYSGSMYYLTGNSSGWTFSCYPSSISYTTSSSLNGVHFH